MAGRVYGRRSQDPLARVNLRPQTWLHIAWTHIKTAGLRKPSSYQAQESFRDPRAAYFLGSAPEAPGSDDGLGRLDFTGGKSGEG